MFSRFSYVEANISTLFLLWLNNILLYGYTTFYLSIHQLIDIWFVSTSFASIFWNILLGEGLLGQRENAYIIFIDIAKFPFVRILQFCVATSNVLSSCFLETFVVSV